MAHVEQAQAQGRRRSGGGENDCKVKEKGGKFSHP
jgi:hypothetical protein